MKLDNISPLIITSMHRSGSSLTASLLQSAGLHLGKELMKGNQSNIKGYFENLDFLDFHKAVLRSHEITDKGWTLQESIEVDDRFIDTAKEIVKRNATAPNWGWKEPRTSLFLEFWGNLLPKAQFLFIYRAPWEVVDSLYRRREDKPFQRNPDLAIKLWLHYNRQILNFYNRFPQRCLLASIYSIIRSPAQYVNAIGRKFDRDLTSPEEKLYDANLLSIQSAEEYRSTLINRYFPEAVQLYRELDTKGWFPDRMPPPNWAEQLQAKPYRVWVLQDWVKNCGLESENARFRADRQDEKRRIKQLERELNITQERCDRTHSELETSRDTLKLTEELLQRSQTQLDEMSGLLAATQSALQKTEAELERKQEELTRQAVKLQRFQRREKIARQTENGGQNAGQIESQLLVWDAWRAYNDRNFEEMVRCLQASMGLSSMSRSQTILHWLACFTQFSQEMGRSFEVEPLVASEPWQRLLGLMRVGGGFANNSSKEWVELGSDRESHLIRSRGSLSP
ncbi:MAG: sulfotransferase [Cyanobacteriota bacterium]|nr:sulfotransferase [Cyanobacteriota bacterium]